MFIIHWSKKKWRLHKTQKQVFIWVKFKNFVKIDNRSEFSVVIFLTKLFVHVRYFYLKNTQRIVPNISMYICKSSVISGHGCRIARRPQIFETVLYGTHECWGSSHIYQWQPQSPLSWNRWHPRFQIPNANPVKVSKSVLMLKSQDFKDWIILFNNEILPEE